MAHPLLQPQLKIKSMYIRIINNLFINFLGMQALLEGAVNQNSYTKIGRSFKNWWEWGFSLKFELYF